MKFIKWIIVLVFLMGILLLSVGFFLGADVLAVFNNDEDYGDLLVYTFEEKPEVIELDFDYRHTYIHLHDEAYVEIQYRQKDDDTWVFNEQANRLSVSQRQPSTWFSFGLRRPSRAKMEVHVFLPSDVLYDLDIHTNVGSIYVEFESNFALKNLNVSSDVGTIRVTHAQVNDDFELSTSTGSARLNDVIGDVLSVNVSVGSIEINRSSFNDLNLRTSTGSIDVKLSTVAGDLKAQTSTGSIKLDRAEAADYDLKTSTGSIELLLVDLSRFYYDLETSTGAIHIGTVNQGQRHQTQQTVNQTIRIKAVLSTGSIDVKEA